MVVQLHAQQQHSPAGMFVMGWLQGLQNHHAQAVHICDQPTSSSGLLYVSCVCCSLCAGLQPVLVHLSKNDKGKFSFNPISVNLMVEVFKVTFALIVLLILVSKKAEHVHQPPPLSSHMR
jgi:hypothetical protein